jgi:hypothetical protein
MTTTMTTRMAGSTGILSMRKKIAPPTMKMTMKMKVKMKMMKVGAK